MNIVNVMSRDALSIEANFIEDIYNYYGEDLCMYST